jgi:2-polyprenyl-6-methoxyphenol hydroxylase-like FAD-dependent oxidoreductase
MLGFLLARAGIDVIVLEKHDDFLRDFRGDTVHPSTLEVIRELGLLDEFLKQPHQEIRRLAARIGGEEVIVSDFSHLPTRCRFVAFMPQWDFLNFLAEHGRRYPTFHLKMRAEVIGLIEEDGRVVGVRAKTPDGPLDVRAELSVGADGRHSVVREQAGLIVEDLGAPIDVLWMRLSRRAHDPEQALGYVAAGQVLVMLQRGDYWQCGLVIAKGAFDDVRQKGIEAFRERIAAIVPFIRNRVGELRHWDDVRLLTVMVDRLRQWYRPGVLCIGDAAHAMSPVGGVGINLAIQDAVAAANILAEPLRRGAPSIEDLDAVQRRRMLPTRMTQRMQVLVQNRILTRALTDPPRSLPIVLRLLRRWPVLRRIPAHVIGLGFRPEHVKTPDVFELANRKIG